MRRPARRDEKDNVLDPQRCPGVRILPMVTAAAGEGAQKDQASVCTKEMAHSHRSPSMTITVRSATEASPTPAGWPAWLEWPGRWPGQFDPGSCRWPREGRKRTRRGGCKQPGGGHCRDLAGEARHPWSTRLSARPTRERSTAVEIHATAADQRPLGEGTRAQRDRRAGRGAWCKMRTTPVRRPARAPRGMAQ